MTTTTLSNYESLRSSLINTTSLNVPSEHITKKFSIKEVVPEAPKGLYEEAENILDKGVNKLFSTAISLVLSDKETILTLPEITKKQEQIDSISTAEKNKPEPYIFKQFYAKNAPAVKRDDAESETHLEPATAAASATRKPSNYELYAKARTGIVSPIERGSFPPKKEGVLPKVAAVPHAPTMPAPSSLIEKLEIQSHDTVSKNNAVVEKPAPKKSFFAWLFAWLFNWN